MLQGKLTMNRLIVPLLCGSLLVSALPAVAADLTLTETGSTLLYPAFTTWATDYAAKHTGVKVTTAATGSGAGIDQATAGTVLIGASDAYMSDDQVKQHPGFLDVPMAISAQMINFNLPGITALNLSGPVLAGIYGDKIAKWNDAAIAALNKGVSLPDQPIIPIHRAEASGDTFIFTQYLSFATQAGQSDFAYGTDAGLPAGPTTAGPAWGPGFGTSIAWPSVTGALEATGNAGMVAKIAATSYSIGYVGISSFADVASAKLGTAAVQSYDGPFVLPSDASINDAAAALTPRTPADERLTLVNAPGPDAYPLVNYEYAIVAQKQADGATASALRNFLLWAIAPDEDNAARLAAVHFVPLPAHIWVLSHDQIAAIH